MPLLEETVQFGDPSVAAGKQLLEFLRALSFTNTELDDGMGDVALLRCGGHGAGVMA